MIESTALQGLADRVVALVRDRDEQSDSFIEANVRATRSRHGLTRFANSFIHQNVGEDTVVVSVMLAVDGRTTGASTTAVDDASLEQLVDAAIASAQLQPVDPHWPGATPSAADDGADVGPPGDLDASTPESDGANTPHEHDASTSDAATASASPEDRADRVEAFVDAGEGLRAAGYVDTELDQVAFASTAGQRVSGATTRATVDGIHQTGRSAGSAHGTARALADLDAGALGRLAADRARRSEDFVDLEPGTYEVVLNPDAVATILTFLAVYGFNAKSHLEGGSFAQLGETQFDPAITILEDPTDPRAIGLPFDAEGSPRHRFALVEDGVTRALAHDRRTAARAGTPTTGSALPGGEGFGAVPTNLVMPGGGTPVDQLIGAVERGLLVTTFHYVRILDPKSQVATGLTRNGTFLVEDGEVVGAVGNLRFTQSFVTALGPGSVLGVGDDDRYADGEFGAGMVICPSLRLAGWTFTGGAQG